MGGCGHRSVRVRGAHSDLIPTGVEFVSVFEFPHAIYDGRTLEIRIVGKRAIDLSRETQACDDRGVFRKLPLNFVNANLMAGHIADVDRLLLKVFGIRGGDLVRYPPLLLRGCGIGREGDCQREEGGSG
jgi:hypothetical protein